MKKYLSQIESLRIKNEVMKIQIDVLKVQIDALKSDKSYYQNLSENLLDSKIALMKDICSHGSSSFGVNHFAGIYSQLYQN